MTANTGGAIMDLGPDLDGWSLWWHYNRERYLTPGASPARPVSPSGEVMLHSSGLRPEVVVEQILPALRSVLDEDTPASLRAAVLLAQARIGGGFEGDELSRSRMEELLIQHLDDGNRMVAETACIGLGILARPTALSPLTALLNDTKQGRELFGRSRVSRRMRTFAAYGIGLVGQRADNEDVRRYATHALADALLEDAGPTPDERVAAVIGLGLIDPADREGAAGGCSCSSNDMLAAVLLELFDDKREDDLVRAQIPPTLARLAPYVSEETREEIVDELIDALGKRREKDPVHQGCALALGLIGDADEDEADREIRRALMKAAVDRDRLTKSLALVSLAQVSTRAGTGKGDPRAATPEARKFLLKRLARARTHERTWAMLALGVFGRELIEQGEVLDRVHLDAVRGELEDSRAPDEVAVCSIAAGLCRDQGASESLFEKVDDLHQNERGLAALALGMTGESKAIEPLHEVLIDSRHEPAVLEQTSISLALLQDPARVAKIVGLLEECDCLLSKRAVAIALGRSRDQAAAEPLLAMLADEDGPVMQRAFAAFGLALLAEQDGRPWSSRISTDLHYRASPATLTGPSGAGILDLP